MKKIITMVAIAMLSGMAFADLSVDWTSGTSGAVVDSSPTDFVVGATVQLIWSTTASITAAGEYDLDSLLGVSEWILSESTTTADLGWFAADEGAPSVWGDDTVGQDINSGYFYTRIYSVDGTAFLDLAEYGAGLSEYNELDTTTLYSDFVLADGYNYIGANETTVSAAVPEPATIGLMGVAGLGLFLARRKNRR